MDDRPFTAVERADIEDVCRAFSKEHGVRVSHSFRREGDVWLTLQDGRRSCATGLSTRLIDQAPNFVTTRFATYLTLSRMLGRGSAASH